LNRKKRNPEIFLKDLINELDGTSPLMSIVTYTPFAKLEGNSHFSSTSRSPTQKISNLLKRTQSSQNNLIQVNQKIFKKNQRRNLQMYKEINTQNEREDKDKKKKKLKGKTTLISKTNSQRLDGTRSRKPNSDKQVYPKFQQSYLKHVNREKSRGLNLQSDSNTFRNTLKSPISTDVGYNGTSLTHPFKSRSHFVNQLKDSAYFMSETMNTNKKEKIYNDYTSILDDNIVKPKTGFQNSGKAGVNQKAKEENIESQYYKQKSTQNVQVVKISKLKRVKSHVIGIKPNSRERTKSPSGNENPKKKVMHGFFHKADRSARKMTSIADFLHIGGNTMPVKNNEFNNNYVPLTKLRKIQTQDEVNAFDSEDESGKRFKLFEKRLISKALEEPNKETEENEFYKAKSFQPSPKGLLNIHKEIHSINMNDQIQIKHPLKQQHQHKKATNEIALRNRQSQLANHPYSKTLTNLRNSSELIFSNSNFTNNIHTTRSLRTPFNFPKSGNSGNLGGTSSSLHSNNSTAKFNHPHSRSTFSSNDVTPAFKKTPFPPNSSKKKLEKQLYEEEVLHFKSLQKHQNQKAAQNKETHIEHLNTHRILKEKRREREQQRKIQSFSKKLQSIAAKNINLAKPISPPQGENSPNVKRSPRRLNKMRFQNIDFLNLDNDEPDQLIINLEVPEDQKYRNHRFWQYERNQKDKNRFQDTSESSIVLKARSNLRAEKKSQKLKKRAKSRELKKSKNAKTIGVDNKSEQFGTFDKCEKIEKIDKFEKIVRFEKCKPGKTGSLNLVKSGKTEKNKGNDEQAFMKRKMNGSEKKYKESENRINGQNKNQFQEKILLGNDDFKDIFELYQALDTFIK
jgi:hypothetical protein